jgi:hypothetical protein
LIRDGDDHRIRSIGRCARGEAPKFSRVLETVILSEAKDPRLDRQTRESGDPSSLRSSG